MRFAKAFNKLKKSIDITINAFHTVISICKHNNNNFRQLREKIKYLVKKCY